MAKNSEMVENTSNDDKLKNVENKAIEVDRVGAILYNERLKRNIDLSEISQKLCIRRYYLEAIEKGEYKNLPSMPYSAGFVDSYAKYLGLNNARITQLFREEIDVRPQTIRDLPAEESVAEARLPSKIYVLIGILAVVFLAWAWRFYSPFAPSNAVNNSSSNVDEEVLDTSDVEYYQTVEKMLKEEDAEENKEGVKEEEPKKEDVKNVKNEDVKEQKTEKQPVAKSEEKEKVEEVAKTDGKSGVEIKITKENTWLEVKDDKKVYISKILKVGESYRLPDVKGLTVSSGKYEGVEVYVDGKLTPVFSRDKKININFDSLLNNH